MNDPPLTRRKKRGSPRGGPPEGRQDPGSGDAILSVPGTLRN